MAKFTLIYFKIDCEGRAGAIRNMCAIGNVPYENQTVNLEEWAKLKPTLEYGQLPVIQVGKVEINQSLDILRYVSKLAGMYPDDPFQAMQVDSLASNLDEIYTSEIYKTMFTGKPKEEIVKMRQETLDLKAGKLGGLLQKLDLQVGVGRSGFLFDFGLSAADLRLFEILGHLCLGTLDGVPKSYIVDNFENLEKFRFKVASIDAISSRFKDKNHRYHGSGYTVEWTCDDDEKKSG